jgi:plastocyanin
MNRIVLFLAAAGAALLLAAPATTGTAARLTIHHQLRGCHSWSFNGGAYKASQSITLSKGSTLAIVNNDVMPHKFMRLSGPALTLSKTANMNDPGAMTTVRFTKAGVYKFVTKAGEDYMKGVKTVGEDNVLRLTVNVR